MSIPLFYGIFSKDFNTNANLAALGCTFGDEQGQILRETDVKAQMLVIDDRNLPTKSDDWSTLLEFKTILFDFERPRNDACADFLKGIADYPIRQILPPAYADCNRSAYIIIYSNICNHWESFCRKQQSQYPNRWCLELAPWNHVVSGDKTACAKTYRNPNALCITAKDGKNRFFYDNAETLRQKLAVAEQYGCQLAVGLYEDLQPFFPIA